MKRTDHGRIEYPQGISASDRRLCRRIIAAVASHAINYQNILVGCSTGLDSTVLAHALAQAVKIQPYSLDNLPIRRGLIYVNHNLRPEEIQKEIEHLFKLQGDLRYHYAKIGSVDISGPGNIQDKAREARYSCIAEAMISEKTPNSAVFIAHHANDVAETKLFQIITGRKVSGISWRMVWDNVVFIRPLLEFSRADLEKYQEIWDLEYCEDSSNEGDKYSRNKIRHHLIPWIEENINPGIIRTLSKEPLE
jgi:tRNA(Ile)-lysidine synthase